jgi:hypothetical protein
VTGLLVEEEAAGGHTVLKHVGRTELQLRARLPPGSAMNRWPSGDGRQSERQP